MKKIIILAMALLAVVATATAQKAEKQITTTVFITDIDCEGCVKKIYDNFFGKGVKSIKLDGKEVDKIPPCDRGTSHEVQVVMG